MATLASLGFTHLQAAQEIWALWLQEVASLNSRPGTSWADEAEARERFDILAKSEGFEDLWDVDFEVSLAE